MKSEDPAVALAERPEKKPDPDKKDIDAIVYAPRFVDPKPFTWLKTLKVGEAASEAATAFGYVGGHPGLQNAQNEVLDNNKTLVAEKVKDGDVLHLIDGGGGV